MIKLVAFDLDGVLVDACDWHYQAFNKALMDVAGFEISKQEHEVTFNGLPTKKKLQLLQLQNKISRDQFDIIELKKQNYTKLIIESEAKIDNEKILFHKELKNLGLKIACVTNSIGETAMLMLSKTGQLPYMDIVIHNQKVRFPKPHAEPYIKAMVYMGALPEETIVVEDSDVGLQAARACGANIWQVKNKNDVNLNSFYIYYSKFYKF